MAPRWVMSDEYTPEVLYVCVYYTIHTSHPHIIYIIIDLPQLEKERKFSCRPDMNIYDNATGNPDYGDYLKYPIIRPI